MRPPAGCWLTVTMSGSAPATKTAAAVRLQQLGARFVQLDVTNEDSVAAAAAAVAGRDGPGRADQ